MKTLSRLSLCALTATMLFLTLGAVAGPRLGGPDPLGDLARLVRTYLDEEGRGEDLAGRDRETMRSLEAKRAVTEEVCAGRLTLLEAAERFRAASPTPIETSPLVETYGIDEEEAACRNVIFWVTAALRDDPPRSNRVVADLEAQLQKHLAQRRKPAV